MNALAADDFEAADLLALARLDDDAPGRAGPLESMQRDAIVQSLLGYHGSKVKTAESLGMSRATIYRKIHQYGSSPRPARRPGHDRRPAIR